MISYHVVKMFNIVHHRHSKTGFGLDWTIFAIAIDSRLNYSTKRRTIVARPDIFIYRACRATRATGPDVRLGRCQLAPGVPSSSSLLDEEFSSDPDRRMGRVLRLREW